MELSRSVAEKVLSIVDAGLVRGLGNPVAGEMCVEAAVCFALGLPHGDNPPCVGDAVRALKIKLNDLEWSSKSARAKGMRRLAIAQLGSENLSQSAFSKLVAEGVIRQIVPFALRAVIPHQKEQKHKDALEAAAVRCEKDGDKNAADAAYAAAYAAAKTAAYAAYAAAYAAYAAAYAANAAAYAANAAANAAAYAAAKAAAKADYAAAKADYPTRDKIYSMLAEIATDALIKLGSQGSQWLDLCA